MLLKLSDETMFRTAGEGEGVLLHVSSTEFFEANPSATYLLERVTRGVTREELVRGLMREFDIDEATSARDVDTFLEELQRVGALKKP